MVIQVAGSGGSYPIDVLPEVFQKLYVLMPFHYGMDMIRETIAGRYENVYWTNLAVMAGMCVLFAALGMLLYYPARPEPLDRPQQGKIRHHVKEDCCR